MTLMPFLAAQSETIYSRPPTKLNLSSARTFSLALFLVVLILNLVLLTKNYYWDGVFFAQVIEDARGVSSTLIHPSHLFDQLFELFIYRAVVAVGIHARALTVVQVANCFLSAATAVIFFRVCVDLFKSTYVSIVLTVVFAFSATWWRFSTDANAYVLAVLLLMACFYFLLPFRRPRPFLIALLHIAALTIHQLCVFFFPVAVIGIVLQSGAASSRQRLANAGKYALTVATTTVVIYYVTFHFAVGAWSLARFISWITYFSPEHGFAFSAWGNFVFSVRSHGRAFLGGRVAFLRDQPGHGIYALAAIAGVLTLAFIFQMLRHAQELRGAISTAVRRFRSLILLCLAWIIPYVIFLFFFIPENTFYRLFYLPAIVLLFGTWLSAAQSQQNHVRRFRGALFAAAFFAANLAFSQYPYAQTRANPPLELALKLNQAWPPGTTIYFAQANSDNSLVKYFNPSTVWIEAKPEFVRQAIAARSNGQTSIWLDSTLIDAIAATEEGKQWLASHTIEKPEYELVNSKYRIRFAQVKR
jgi:hypothetical protein